jgi:hypothetical protein
LSLLRRCCRNPPFLKAQQLLQLARRHVGGLDKGGRFRIAAFKNAGADPLSIEGAKNSEAAVWIVDGLAIAAATFRRQTTVSGATRALSPDEVSKETPGKLGGKVVDRVSKDLTKDAAKEIVHVNFDAGPFILQLAVHVFDVTATADERPGLFGLVCSSHDIWQSSS